MEPKHKVGETIRVNRAACGVDSFTIGDIVTQKEVLDYYGLSNSEEFPEELNDHFVYVEENNMDDVFGFDCAWVFEKDILDEDEIYINNHIDPCCNVWHNDKCIGCIQNTTTLDDFLVQLKRKFDAGEDVSDYYIEYYQKSSRETFKLHIDTEYFTIDNAPEGFYDYIDNCMKELMGF